MAGPVDRPIRGQCVLGLEARDEAGQCVLLLGDSHDMDVIGHQAVAEDVHLRALRVSHQQFEIEAIVSGCEEYLLTIVTALSHVMSHIGDHDTRASGHAVQYHHPVEILN